MKFKNHIYKRTATRRFFCLYMHDMKDASVLVCLPTAFYYTLLLQVENNNRLLLLPPGVT